MNIEWNTSLKRLTVLEAYYLISKIMLGMDTADYQDFCIISLLLLHRKYTDKISELWPSFVRMQKKQGQNIRPSSDRVDIVGVC